MNKGVVFLNYTAFLVLYIASFVFFYIKNTEIVGFYLLFVVNTACLLFSVAYFGSLIDLKFISRIVSSSIILSGLLHSIALIFILIMISNMKVKYENTFGTPINLPPMYKNKLEEFKQRSVITFLLCSILVLVFMIYFDNINIIFKDEMIYINDIVRNKYQLLILLFSFLPVIVSYFQLQTAHSFSSLTRQNLMR
jgi:hypothetical protein